MNGQGSGGGGSTPCYTAVMDVDAGPGGEASSSTGFEDFLEMFGARRHYSSGDLFDLVRQGGVRVGSSMEVQATSLRLLSPSPVAMQPSEDDMAAWLYPIVSGQEHGVVARHDNHQPSNDAAGLAAMDDAPANHKRERRPNMQEKCRSGGAEDSTENYSGCGCGSRKKATTGGARRSHPAETHKLTEKRRRRKINDKLKTLQRLVPGCDDKTQASTLDRTIQHIKSLQQQIQAMSSFDGMKPPAVYQVVPPPYLPPDGAANRPCSSGAGAMAIGHVVRQQGSFLHLHHLRRWPPFGP